MRKNNIRPLNMFTVAAGSPSEVWIVSPPTRMPPRNIEEKMIKRGFNFANHATMIEVNP